MKKEYGINGSMRKSVTPTKTEYFLFNSLGNMKAYSDNGEIYGYYGYDAKGERTYKAQLKAIIDNTSIYPNAKVLNIDRLFLYPDGFTTITQDGNYTKHYYAETARIASKIGSGSNNTISGGVVQTDTLQAIMRRELSELCNDTVYLINYSFPQITHLQGDSGKYEDGLYYYTGNHQHSTKFITDINGAITQAFMFLPGGQVISEYNQYWMLDTLPRFIFQAAEQDIESGLYCMGVRYLDPVRLRFNSRDAMFEKYYWMSSYNAMGNNPLRYVDPTGMKWEDTDGNKTNEKKANELTQIANSKIEANNSFIKRTEKKIAKMEQKGKTNGIELKKEAVSEAKEQNRLLSDGIKGLKEMGENQEQVFAFKQIFKGDDENYYSVKRSDGSNVIDIEYSNNGIAWHESMHDVNALRNPENYTFDLTNNRLSIIGGPDALNNEHLNSVYKSHFSFNPSDPIFSWFGASSLKDINSSWMKKAGVWTY